MGLSVSSFQGQGGQAQLSGRVQIDDIIYAVNGVRLPSAMSARQMAELVQRVGKPVYIAFMHPEGRMSIIDYIPIKESPVHVQVTRKTSHSQSHSPTSLQERTSPIDVRVGSSMGGAMLKAIALAAIQQPNRELRAVQAPTSHDSLRAPDGYVPELIPGENALAMVPASMETAEYRDGTLALAKESVSGVLFSTSFRIIFHKFYRNVQHATQHSNESIAWQLPIHTLLKAECQGRDAIFGIGGSDQKTLTLTSKDGQLVKFTVQPKMGEALVQFNRSLISVAFSEIRFPFSHFIAVEAAGGRTTPSFEYSMLAEYERLGLTSATGLRVMDQGDLKMCASYPRWIVVPEAMTNEELIRVAAYRSKERIPAIVWRDKETRATMSRSSQPLVGMSSNRCFDDEKLLRCLMELSGKQRFVIIDARRRIASYGNKAIGKGTELLKWYPGCEISFCDIENIHSVRESASGLHALCRPFALQQGNAFAGKLDSTQWLHHVYSILTSAVRVCDVMRNAGCSCLIHCKYLARHCKLPSAF
jgi:hypothetical protein